MPGHSRAALEAQELTQNGQERDDERKEAWGPRGIGRWAVPPAFAHRQTWSRLQALPSLELRLT